MIRTPAIAVFLLSLSCRASPAPAAEENPAASGFDAAGSDARAVVIADEVMRAMGGRAAWDATRCIAWNFFWRREHLWDKATGDYKLVDGQRAVRMNLGTLDGRVWDSGLEIRDPGELEKALAEARSIWINDSYWLLMPYKLKDTGVTLRHAGESSLADGRAADVLELTFHDVGDTPGNKYEVLVSRDRHLVEQ